MELLQPKPTPPKKRPSRLLRLLAFLVTLALMAGAVALVANRDKLNLDGVRRWFNYRSLERSDSGQAESFSYDGGSASSFATLDDGLLVCSTASIRLYSGSGTLYVCLLYTSSWSPNSAVSPSMLLRTRSSSPAVWAMVASISVRIRS